MRGNAATSVRRDRAFTLVELLVVMAIIGILVALLLPAVQAAREAARRVHCTNNLKQISLGFLNHHESQQAFPTGGWGWWWIGDPDRGYKTNQPGSWTYNVLPYIEQGNVRVLGSDGAPDTITPAQMTGALQATQVPIEAYICPSRRTATLYPNPNSTSPSGTQAIDANGHATDNVSKTDYAANGGDYYTSWTYGTPQPGSISDGNNNIGFSDMSLSTGIVFQRSTINIAMIADGTSNTLLIGEKYLNPDSYATGLDWTDDQASLSGDDWDVVRWAYTPNGGDAQAGGGGSGNLPPMPDTPGYALYIGFGSAHAGAFNAALCDGSVRNIAYSVDITLFKRLCNRKDRLPIDWSSL